MDFYLGKQGCILFVFRLVSYFMQTGYRIVFYWIHNCLLFDATLSFIGCIIVFYWMQNCLLLDATLSFIGCDVVFYWMHNCLLLDATVRHCIYRATVEFHVLCLAALVIGDNLLILVYYTVTINGKKK